MTHKVISGGQKGVDRIALEAARNSGIETGGIAPKDYWTEDGPDPSLAAFGLTEDINRSYLPRTIKNIVNSDGTVLFGDMNSAGSRRTIEWLIHHRKPYIINPTSDSLREWIFINNINILNVAGNRASKLTQKKMGSIYTTLRLAFTYWKNPDLPVFP
jgi:hypothetical protein